jgi:hypothetical protein
MWFSKSKPANVFMGSLEPGIDGSFLTDEDTAQCAWCLEAAGLPMRNGSHGICSYHAAVVLEQYQAVRAARRNGGR